MKRNKRKGDKMRVLLFCVLAALVAAPAFGQFSEGNKNRQNQGNSVLTIVDSDTNYVLVKEGGVSGGLSVDDADRDRDNYLWSPAILNASLYEGITPADSAIVNVAGYRQMWLTIHAYPDSGAAAATALTAGFQYAVQVFFLANGAADSTSMFSFPYRATDSPDGTTGQIVGWGQVGAGTATALQETEIPVNYFYKVGADPLVGYQRGGFIFPLSPASQNMIPLWCTHVMIKVRLLAAPGTQAIKMNTTIGLLAAS